MGLFSQKSGETVSFIVPDMNCGHCEAKVSTAVESLEGVKKARATSKDKRLVLEYTGTAPDLDAVNSVLKPAGYTAEAE